MAYLQAYVHADNRVPQTVLFSGSSSHGEARIGDRVEPMPQLGIETVKITKGGAKEKVLADVTKRPFHFAFGLRPVRPASVWLEEQARDYRLRRRRQRDGF